MDSFYFLFFATMTFPIMKGVTIMKKLYYAYIIVDLVEYFEKKLEERKDKIKIVSIHPAVSEEGSPAIKYILEAEEGIINSKWELK